METYDRILTFAKDVKNELANRSYTAEEAAPLLAGFFHLAKKKKDAESMTIKTELASVAKLIYSLSKRHLSTDSHINYSPSTAAQKSYIVKIHDTQTFDCQKFLEDITLNFSHYLSVKNIRNFLTGLFLSSGSVSNPQRGNYYLEISFENLGEAQQIAKKIAAFSDERHMDFKIIERRGKQIMYLKKSEQISNFLAFIGASVAMLNYENIRLTRDFFNNEHRLDICAVANYQRTSATGRKNIEDINTIKQTIGIGSQDEKTKLIVALREENPDASYQELAELASKKGVVISKSSVAHIFKAIADLARRLG